MKYLVTRDGELYDLKSKEISSIEQGDDYINVFYYNRDKGQYLECDNNGGRSMDTIYTEDILREASTLDYLCNEFRVIKRGYPPFEIERHQIEEFFRLGYEIVGTIWVETKLSNGKTICTLKPIAYVNDDGVLELI